MPSHSLQGIFYADALTAITVPISGFSALEVVLHDYALYKSTFTLLTLLTSGTGTEYAGLDKYAGLHIIIIIIISGFIMHHINRCCSANNGSPHQRIVECT